MGRQSLNDMLKSSTASRESGTTKAGPAHKETVLDHPRNRHGSWRQAAHGLQLFMSGPIEQPVNVLYIPFLELTPIRSAVLLSTAPSPVFAPAFNLSLDKC
jgi:hypothetical protein